MIDLKSDVLSHKHELRGDRYFVENKFPEALVEYNKALAYAVSDHNLASNYANRSKVYLKYKNYEMCLQNIQWAIINEKSVDKIQELLEIEEICRKLKAVEKVNPKRIVNDFFRLSYPSNPKIPFIVNCLKLQSNTKFGRGIYTNRDLKPGDMIIVEKPILSAMEHSSQYKKCCNCLLKNQMNLIPCFKTASLMFCSNECRNEIYSKYDMETFECLISGDNYGTFQKIYQTFLHAFDGEKNLQKFALENDLKEWQKTVFDFDFSNPNDENYNQNALMSILSYFPSDHYERLEEFRKEIVKKIIKSSSRDLALEKLLSHVGVVWDASNCGIDEDVCNKKVPLELTSWNLSKLDKEYRLHLVSPLINHSCYPNVEKVLLDNQIIFYVSRPINAGRQLFLNASAPEIFQHATQKRQMYMISRNYFYCLCFYCRNKMKLDDLPRTHMPPKPNPSEVFSSISMILHTIMMNWKLIENAESLHHAGTQASYWATRLNRVALDAVVHALYK